MEIINKWLCILLLGFGYRKVVEVLQGRFTILDQFQLPGLNWQQVLIVLASSLLLSIFIPNTLRRPSDIFVLIYALSVVAPKIFLGGIFQDLFYADILLIVSFLMSPIVIMSAASRVTFRMPKIWRRDATTSAAKQLHYIVFVAMFLYIFFEFRHYLDFTFSSHYERRLAFRAISQSVAFGYLYNFFAYALTPFIAFAAVQDRRWTFLGLAIFSVGLVFSISGEKFPFLLVMVSLASAFMVSMRRPTRTVLIILSMSVINVAAISEIALLGSAYWSDYFFRRFVVVPAYNVELYYDYMLRLGDMKWWGSGEKATTFLVGELYFPAEKMNLNVNFIFIELAINGLIGLVLAIVSVTCWLKIVDVMYHRTLDLNLFAIPLLVGMLAYEQRIYLVFLSSGVGLLFVLIYASQLTPKLSVKLRRFSGSI